MESGTVKQLARFIQSYLTSFTQLNYSNEEPDIKGKKPVALHGARKPSKCDKKAESWRTLDEGWNKLNVDASFIKDENKGAWGAILRGSWQSNLISLGYNT
jgi:hypothetical protein